MLFINCSMFNYLSLRRADDKNAEVDQDRKSKERAETSDSDSDAGSDKKEISKEKHEKADLSDNSDEVYGKLSINYKNKYKTSFNYVRLKLTNELSQRVIGFKMYVLTSI